MMHFIRGNPVSLLLGDYYTREVADAIRQEYGLDRPMHSEYLLWLKRMDLKQNLALLALNPWMTILPGLRILFTVLAFNLLGDGLRHALDPRLKTWRRRDRAPYVEGYHLMNQFDVYWDTTWLDQ